MEYQEAAKIKNRMVDTDKNGRCRLDCEDCSLSRANNNHKLSCGDFERAFPAEAEAKLAEWAKAHPLKTRFTVLKEQYPNCRLCGDIPVLDACDLDKSLSEECDGGCCACRAKFWNSEVCE